jgi:hypothetical protein
MRPAIQDNDTNRIKEGGKAFENWRAVFLRRYLFVRRVKLPRGGEALGCRRDFPGAEYLIAVTNREDEGLHREVVAAHLASRPSF